MIDEKFNCQITPFNMNLRNNHFIVTCFNNFKSDYLEIEHSIRFWFRLLEIVIICLKIGGKCFHLIIIIGFEI